MKVISEQVFNGELNEAVAGTLVQKQLCYKTSKVAYRIKTFAVSLTCSTAGNKQLQFVDQSIGSIITLGSIELLGEFTTQAVVIQKELGIAGQVNNPNVIARDNLSTEVWVQVAGPGTTITYASYWVVIETLSLTDSEMLAILY